MSLTRVMILATVLMILAMAAALLVRVARADELRLADILQPHTTLHLNRCDEHEGFYRGCNQLLALCDQSHGGRVFWSPDYHTMGTAPLMNRTDLCNVWTSEAARRVIHLKFDEPDVYGATMWICAEGWLESAWQRTCIDPDDPMAVPPVIQASADWLGQWHCDHTVSGLPAESYEGAYFSPVGMWSMVWSSESEIDAAAAYPFADDPGYRMAYADVALTLADLGGPVQNPFDPVLDSFEHMRFGLTNFSSVLFIVGTNQPDAFPTGQAALAWYAACPVMSPPWHVIEQATQWYRAIFLGDGQLPAGWPETESPALRRLHDHIIDGLTRYDPLRILCWYDVPTEPATWGQIKALYQRESP